MHASIRTRSGLGVNEHLPLRLSICVPRTEMRQRSVFDYQGMVWSTQKQDEKCRRFEEGVRMRHSANLEIIDVLLVL